MDVKVRRRAVALALSVPGRRMPLHGFPTAQTVGCDPSGRARTTEISLHSTGPSHSRRWPVWFWKVMNAHNSHHRPTSFGHSLRRHFAARCLHVVSDLGVADHIGDQPARIGELASSCEVDDPDGLDRVLRLLRPMAPSSASTAATATRPHHSCCAQRSSHDNACLPRSPAHATDPQKMPLAPEQIEAGGFWMRRRRLQDDPPPGA